MSITDNFSIALGILTFLITAKCITPTHDLQDIESSIRSASAGADMPPYTLVKLSYANLTKTASTQLAQCLLNSDYATDEKYELVPSVSIHEGDSLSYPVMIRLCNHYFTLNGHKIASFQGKEGFKYRHFVSSVKNQYTYFAEAQWNASEGNTTVLIQKLQSRNKKLSLSEELVLQVPLFYGEVTGFVNSFSLSLRLFAISTSKQNILFYRSDGTFDHIIPLSTSASNQQSDPSQLYPILTKLNTQLGIHSSIIKNGHSFLYVISTTGKNETLRKFMLPHIDQQLQGHKMELRFSDQNWNEFYLKIGNKVCVYEVSAAKQAEHGPKYWYPLLTKSDTFHIILNMLVVQSSTSSNKQNIKFYYNLTDGSSSMLRLPNLPCASPTPISSSSQSQTSNFVCSLCHLAYECYSLTTHSDPSASSQSKLEYTDYSKFRVPLILISLGFVVFISITRSKKGKPAVEQDKEQEAFMNELQKRDKNLYEALKKNRNASANENTARNNRQRGDVPRSGLSHPNEHEQ